MGKSLNTPVQPVPDAGVRFCIVVTSSTDRMQGELPDRRVFVLFDACALFGHGVGVSCEYEVEEDT